MTRLSTSDVLVLSDMMASTVYMVNDWHKKHINLVDYLHLSSKPFCVNQSIRIHRGLIT